jgi:uncharacterized protein YecE (DUF72 family)
MCGPGGIVSKVYLGTSGWSYTDWIGPLYPPGTPATRYLAVYATVFRSVEIDSTFYRVPTATAVEAWRRRTPDDFVFAAKVPRTITHDRPLLDAPAELLGFAEVMRLLGPKCGPLLLQFPPAFVADPEAWEGFEQLLPLLPSDQRFAVEVRHRSWLQEPFFALLRRHNVALVQLDLPWMPRTIPSTADWAYLRWLGDRQSIQSDFSWVRWERDEELAWWADQMRDMTVFGYANNHYQGYSPATLQRLQALLGFEPEMPTIVQPRLL